MRTNLAGSAKKRAASLHLEIDAQVGARYVEYLREHLLAAHRLGAPGLRELSVAIVGARKMGELHDTYLKIPEPTDVLTFELEHGRNGKVMSGEVVVCLPVAREMARVNRRAVREELLLYALHGMLHLGGFDDRTRKGYAAMHAMEDEILIRLGVGPVFQASSKSTAGSPPRRGAR
jgi:rRNA maturation RNase YbeY